MTMMNKTQILITETKIWNWLHNPRMKTQDMVLVVNSGLPTKVSYQGMILYEGPAMQGFDFTIYNGHVAPATALMADKAKFNFTEICSILN